MLPAISGISFDTSERARKVRRAAGLAFIAAWYYTAPTAAMLDSCAEVCTTDSDPAEECLYVPEDPEMPAFESTCENYGVYYQPGYCGDGFCGEVDGETPSSCESDCFIGPGTDPNNTPQCGDSQCEQGESNSSCAQDCPPKNPQVCGDGACELTETQSNCSADCEYTDFCWDTADCPGWATCRARRCVYDPVASICSWSTGGYFGCFGGERCVQISTSGTGICMPYF